MGKRAIRRTGLVMAAALAMGAVGSCDSPRRAGAPFTTSPPVARQTTTTASSAPPPTTGPPALPASLVGTEWTRLPTNSRIVALTFDAGANDAGAVSILSTLASTATPATFFLTGHWVQYYPAMAARIGAMFPVGNHTLTHPDLTNLSDGEVRHQVTAAAAAIKAASGRNPSPLFRFPYGARNARTIALVNALGYGSIRWTVDTLGWMGTSGGQTVQSVVSRVLSNLAPGEIVLMHLGSNPTDHSTLDAAALPIMIRDLTQRGYGFVTLPGFIRSLSSSPGKP